MSQRSQGEGQGPIIYVVDDDPSIRDAASLALETLGLETRCFENVANFLEGVEPNRGGCILLDVRLPDTSGLALQMDLDRREINLPVIMMSGKADVTTAVMAMRQGAIDFLEKPFSARQLLERVQEGVELDRQQRGDQQAEQQAKLLLGRLTAREHDVFKELVKGSKNREIAKRLHVSVRTVEVHRANVLHKLDAHSIADLVHLAQIAGLTSANTAAS